MSWLSTAIGKIPGVGGVINAVAKPIQSIARGAIENLPGGSAALGVGDALGRVIPNPGGVLSSALGSVAGGGSGGGSISPAVLALAAAQAANSASLGKTANDYSDKAWNLANDSYTSRAGLRDLGIKGLTNNKAPDLSSLSAIRAQNPVAAKAGVSGAPMAPPAGGLPLAPPPMRADATPSMPGGVMRELPPELSTPINGDLPSRVSNTQGLRSALRPIARRDGEVVAA